MKALTMAVGGLTLLVVLIVAEAALAGYVVTQLWGWFVVGFGLPQIGIAHAVGLRLLARAFSDTAERISKEDDRKDKKPWVIAVSIPFMWLVVWGVGAVAHSLM